MLWDLDIQKSDILTEYQDHLEDREASLSASEVVIVTLQR